MRARIKLISPSKFYKQTRSFRIHRLLSELVALMALANIHQLYKLQSIQTETAFTWIKSAEGADNRFVLVGYVALTYYCWFYIRHTTELLSCREMSVFYNMNFWKLLNSTSVQLFSFLANQHLHNLLYKDK